MSRRADRVVVLDPFLGGSAPRLQHLYLWRVVIPSLPNLLLSATDLTTLRLLDIPADSYISPETMATCLSALTKLNRLDLLFQSRTPGPNPPSPSPDTRIVLPALTEFYFQGVCQYLETLLAQVDAPLLEEFKASYFDQLEFDISQANRFIGYQGLPMPKDLHLGFCPITEVRIVFCRRSSGEMKMDDQSLHLEWSILCKELDGQVSSLVDVCSQIVPMCFTIEQLFIGCGGLWSWYPQGRQLDNVDPTVCHDLFRSFTSMKTLELSTELEPFIAAALEKVSDELVAEVFPALERIVIHESNVTRMRPGISRGIKPFVAARQVAGCPVVVKEN
jgi:hypothetical protein